MPSLRELSYYYNAVSKYLEAQQHHRKHLVYLKKKGTDAH